MTIDIRNRTAVFLIALFLPLAFAHALARAPFADPSKLQPIPAYVQPNVSGNVQSAHTPANYPAPGETNTVTNNAPTGNPSAAAQQQTQTSGGNTPWILALIGILLLLALFVFVRRRSSE